jgi:hypothetical protein
MDKRIKVGDRVATNMGVRLSGVVIHPFLASKATDGTYRAPERHETAVWVRWNDGTSGWIHRAFVQLVQS